MAYPDVPNQQIVRVYKVDERDFNTFGEAIAFAHDCNVANNNPMNYHVIEAWTTDHRL